MTSVWNIQKHFSLHLRQQEPRVMVSRMMSFFAKDLVACFQKKKKEKINLFFHSLGGLYMEGSIEK